MFYFLRCMYLKLALFLYLVIYLLCTCNSVVSDLEQRLPTLLRKHGSRRVFPIVYNTWMYSRVPSLSPNQPSPILNNNIDNKRQQQLQKMQDCVVEFYYKAIYCTPTRVLIMNIKTKWNVYSVSIL